MIESDEVDNAIFIDRDAAQPELSDSAKRTLRERMIESIGSRSLSLQQLIRSARMCTVEFLHYTLTA
jgi:hypothetical protein